MSTVTSKCEDSSSRRLSGTALAVRTISGQTKLLVPVSAAAATAKKPHTHHKQILVVPTPGGGARLATVANSSSNSSSSPSSSHIRHSHLHPHHNYSSSGSGGVGGSNNNNRRDSSSYPFSRSSSIDGYKSNAPSSSRYNGNHDNSAIDTAQLLRQQQIQQQQLLEKYLKLKEEEEMIPEWKRKEDFFAALGLVTKQALKEIQNKKCERKRRTTANPQFSNAAIEAKRINAMEIAAKRAKRKEMAAAAERAPASTSAPLTRIARRNSQMPIVPIQSSSSIRTSIRPSTTSSSSSQPPGASSSSTIALHHKAVFRRFPNSPTTSVTVVPEKSRSLVERLKTKYQLHSASNPSHRSYSSISQNDNTSNNPRSTNLTAPRPILVKTLRNCDACCETCDPDLDAIMACKPCRVYFHATCVSSVEEINKTNSVPCPSCDKRTSITFDGFSPNFEDLETTPAAKESRSGVETTLKAIAVPEENEEDEDESNLMETDNNRSSSKTGGLVNTLQSIRRGVLAAGKKRPIIVMTKAEFLNSQARNHGQSSIKTKESMLNRKNEILKLIAEGKKRYSELASTLSNLKEDKVKLLQERRKIEDCLKKVTNVIKLVNKTDEEPVEDPVEVKDETKTPEESLDAVNSNNESSNDNNHKPDEPGERFTTIVDDLKPIGDESSVKKSSKAEDSREGVSVDDKDKDKVDEAMEVEVPKEEVARIKEDPEKEEEAITVGDKNRIVGQRVEPIPNESTMSIGEEEEIIETSGSCMSSMQAVNESDSKEWDGGVSLLANESFLNESSDSNEVITGVTSFEPSEEGMVIEEIVNLGGDEVLITTTEEDGNLVVLENDPIQPVESVKSCNQFEDETSAAVASIQDQLDNL